MAVDESDDLTNGTKDLRKVKTVLLVDVGAEVGGDVDGLLDIDLLDREAVPSSFLHPSNSTAPYSSPYTEDGKILLVYLRIDSASNSFPPTS